MTTWLLGNLVSAQYRHVTEAGTNPIAGEKTSILRESTAKKGNPEEVIRWRQEAEPVHQGSFPLQACERMTDGQQASQTVQEALSILHTLQPHRHRLARNESNSGFLGASLYYAKEVFCFLFMSSNPQDDYLGSTTSRPKLSRPLTKAVKLLEEAAEKEDADAIFILAEMNFFGNYTHPKSYREAFRRYNELASLNGNSSAQHMLGFMYATGIGGAVGRDQAKALMYHTFAALGGSTKSQMTLGYRHNTGVGVTRNCNEAAYWYKEVADKAIAYSRSGPPGGQAIQKDIYRIADESGGVYGEGASVVSSGMHAHRGGPNSDQHEAFDDVLEYLDLISR